jgi:hypothetical protein
MTAADAADSIPAIPEEDASGDIATLYADLRATLGVPFVNLIWRHLATIQGGLAWAWTLVKPLYVSGELVSRAAETSTLVCLPSLTPLPDFVWDGAAILRTNRQVIVRLIDSYNHANGVNFLALLAAVSALREGLPMPVGTARVPPKPTGHRAEADALPALPGLSELSPTVLDLVRRLDEFGRLGPSDAIASLYRHLAHWPAFLSIAYVALEPLHRSGELARAQESVIAFGRRHSVELASLVGRDLPALTPESRSAVLSALDEFTRLMIGRMIVTGKAMRSLIPPDGEAQYERH